MPARRGGVPFARLRLAADLHPVAGPCWGRAFSRCSRIRNSGAVPGNVCTSVCARLRRTIPARRERSSSSARREKSPSPTTVLCPNDAETQRAAALVADACTMFLLGPFYFDRPGVTFASAGEAIVDQAVCDVMLAILRPGFGMAEEDRVILSIDRASKNSAGSA